MLWLRCVWFVSVYLPTVATGVLSHYAEGQMSQNASQRDRLVTPVDLQPHGALSADRIQYIRRLLVPNTIWRAPMEVKDTFSLRMSESLWSKILAVSTWREYMTHKVKKKKKVLVCENFTIIKLSKLVAYRVVDPCLMSNMDAKTPCHSFYFKQNNWTLIKTSWSSLPLIRYMVSHLLITFLWCKRCEWVCLHSCCTWNTPQRQRSLSVYHPG